METGVSAHTGARRWHHEPSAVILLVVTLVALAIRYLNAFHGGFSSATDLDGPVYFAGAVSFVHGRLPYLNFAFAQPPGVILAAAPMAALARGIGTNSAFVVVRVLMPLVDAAGVVVAGFVVRHRGPLAVLVTSGLLAVYLPDIIVSRTLLLEVPLDVCCLVGVALAFDHGAIAAPRRLGAAGMAFGLATAFKLWAIFPLAVLLLVCLISRSGVKSGIKRATVLGAGAVLGFGIPCAPFIVAAPGAFWHDAVVSQWQRISPRVSFSERMGEMLGLAPAGKPSPVPAVAIALGLGLFVAVVAAAALAMRVRKSAPSPLDAFSLAASLVVFGVLLVPAEFPYHYPAFLGPFVALTLGLAVGALAQRVPRSVAAYLVMGMAGAGLLGLSFVSDVSLLGPKSPWSPASVIDRIIPPTACVVTDFTAATIAANRFDTAPSSCPDIVDPIALDLSLDHHTPFPSGYTPSGAVVAAWRSALARAQWVLLTPTARARIPFTRSLSDEFQRQFRLVAIDRVKIYRRR
jgi:hypothetical protein